MKGKKILVLLRKGGVDLASFALLLFWLDRSNRKMLNENRGFTLIEILLVIGLIGILAMLSIPAYKNAISKTEVKRVVGELGAYRSAFETVLGNGVSVDNESLGYTPSELTSGTMTTQIASLNPDGSGHIEVTMGGTVQAGLAGIVIRYERSASGSWSCVIEPSGASGWNASYAPKHCTVI